MAQHRAEASMEPSSRYFLGCRKDNRCNCEICLASINSIADLIHRSSHSTLTKLFSSARRRPLFGSEKTPSAKPKPLTLSSSVETPTELNSRYFPGCRKDSSCNCDICLASINGTLDLIHHFTELSSFSSDRHPLFGSEKTPPAKPKPSSTPQTPLIQSTAKSRPIEERVVAEKATAIRTKVLVALMVFSSFLIVEKGFPKMVFWRGCSMKLLHRIHGFGWVESYFL